jgi:hypothetical protein
MPLRLQKITKELLEAIVEEPPSTISDHQMEYQNEIASYAQDIRQTHNGPISSWSQMNPQETKKAMKLTNDELQREGVTPVTSDIFRWRMVQTVSFIKRKPKLQAQKPGAPVLLLHSCETPRSTEDLE